MDECKMQNARKLLNLDLLAVSLVFKNVQISYLHSAVFQFFIFNYHIRN